MKVPRVHGIIKRRLLVNFRVDPLIMGRYLPSPFRPKLQRGFSIGGICLIRLEGIRPPLVPPFFGLTSENAAHRVAVEWDDGNEGVFVPRRDSNSRVNWLLGGRLFPGSHHPARFEVIDADGRVSVALSSRDGSVQLSVSAREAASLPDTSVFASLAEASAFFERGSLGYSATSEPSRFDGMTLDTHRWAVAPLDVDAVSSSFFEDGTTFPPGSVEFDHALIMRDIEHDWVRAPDLYGRARAAQPEFEGG